MGDPIRYKRMVRTHREWYHPIRARYMFEGKVDARCREAQVRVEAGEDKGAKKKYGGCF